jgi:uncharacterized protein (TIGR03067 family)
MRALAPAMAILASLSARVTQGQTATPVPSDSARLQGSWMMVSGAVSGEAMPATYLGTMQRTLTGNALTVMRGGQIFFQATIQLDPSQTPHTIDYHMTTGPTAGSIQRGIYRIAGDTVYFCFGGVNADRPLEFTTRPGDGRTLSVWLPLRPPAPN